MFEQESKFVVILVICKYVFTFTIHPSSLGQYISSFKYVFMFTHQDFICSFNKFDLYSHLN